MKNEKTVKWTAISGMTVVGIMVGLILAGAWDAIPSGHASSLALKALEDPATARVEAPAVIFEAVPARLEKSSPVEETGVQQRNLPSLRQAAAQVRPAVVSIEVESYREGIAMREPSIPENFWRSIPDDMREYFRFESPEQGEGQPERQRVQGEGSGFLFSRDGYIITNNHVVGGASRVTVILPDRRRYEAQIVGTDEITDVAVIKIDADEDLPTVPLGNSDDLEIGDWVLAVGNPLQFDYTVTAGIISAKGRSLDLGPRDSRGVRLGIQDYIQTDAAINQGNSGGPLVDLNGRVVGINTAIASSTGLYAGYGFAIPINLARSVVRDLIEFGQVKRSWLGVLFQIVDAPIARSRSLSDNPPIGAWVTEVTPGGSADEAGVRQDDIILEIGDVTIQNNGQLQTIISTAKPGTEMDMLIYRGGNSRREGRRINLTVTLQERPAEAEQPEPRSEEEKADKLGLEVTELTRDQARELDFDGEGVLIELVERYSPAYDAFIRQGFIVVELDGEPVEDVKGYGKILDELRSGDYVMIRLYIPGAPEGSRYSTRPLRVR